MPGYAKKVLMKYKEGGKVKEYQSDLMKEVKGMGPEGKRYLKDKLQGKKYEGELKDEFKEDLDKELRGMSKKGKEELKKLLGLGDPFEKVREELDGKKKDKDEESIGELMAYSEKGYAKGGVIHTPVKAEPKDVLRTKRGSKPDFLDLDKDGDRKESMKQAMKDKKIKKMKHGGMVMKIIKKIKDK